MVTTPIAIQTQPLLLNGEESPDIQYPEPDGTPMAESDQAREALIYGVESLRQHFEGRSNVYVSGNLWISYQRGVEDAACAPDVFVIFGVPNRFRRSYRVWEEGGKTPDFILEITSQKTRNNDSVTKPVVYAQMGVREYFQYDPTGEYLRPSLQGFRLLEGDYRPIAPLLGDQLGLRIYSEVLGLELRVSADNEFRFWNPVTEKVYLPSQEALNALQEQIDALQREREIAERARQEAVRKREDAERERDELRQQLAELRRQLEQNQ